MKGSENHTLNPYCLLLTATIHPAGMTKLAVADPLQRQAQYLSALRWWLAHRDHVLNGIVFVENSNADLAPFRQLANHENPSAVPVEFLSLGANDYPRELGKGYGEFLMVDQAVLESNLLQASPFLVKVTGRLTVGNLGKMLRRLPATFDIAADVHPTAADPCQGVVDTRLMILARSFYMQFVAGCYRLMNDSQAMYAEHVFFNLIARAPNIDVVPRLPKEPHWKGVSGSMGIRYDDLWSQIEYPAKAVRRMIERWRHQPDLRRTWNAMGGP